VYDNFFINLAVHTSLLKNLQFKKAKILQGKSKDTPSNDYDFFTLR